MMTLHPSKEQLAAEPTVQMTLGDAVRGGTIANETLGYFIARTYLFLLRAGCKAEQNLNIFSSKLVYLIIYSDA